MIHWCWGVWMIWRSRGRGGRWWGWWQCWRWWWQSWWCRPALHPGQVTPDHRGLSYSVNCGPRLNIDLLGQVSVPVNDLLTKSVIIHQAAGYEVALLCHGGHMAMGSPFLLLSVGQPLSSSSCQCCIQRLISIMFLVTTLRPEKKEAKQLRCNNVTSLFILHSDTSHKIQQPGSVDIFFPK